MTTQVSPRPRRRRLPWILAGVSAFVALAIVAAFVVPPLIAHRDAEAAYADAVAARDDARAEWDEARAAVREEHAPVDDVVTRAEAVATEEVKPYLDEALWDEVVQLVDEVAEIEQGVPNSDDAPAPGPSEAPADTEALRAATDRARDAAEAYEDGAAAFAAAAEALADAVPRIEQTTTTLRETITEAANRLEEENISAESVARIRMHAAARLAATSEENVSAYVSQYATRAQEVEESQAAELAEKDQGDGLVEVRLEIEEFVRSITGAARVDFDWEPIVNGLGDGVSAGGMVEWQYSDGGYATMTLSNSVAAYWPDERFESLVVHESGHVITSQCREMLLDTFDGDVEMMATAWAIGMGYTNTWGNGVDFYYDGVWPPDDLIEESKSCR